MEEQESIKLLKSLGFDGQLIKRIIADNPTILSRSITDLKELIAKLREIGLIDIVDLIDANPYILNLDAYEIDEYIEDRQKSGASVQEIADELESQPALFLGI